MSTLPHDIISSDSATGRLNSRRRRHRLMFLLGSMALLLTCVAVAGSIGAYYWLRPVGAVAEERSEPRNDAEKLVRQYILNNAKDPKKVEFLKWGPHMTRAEWVGMLDEGGVEAGHKFRKQDFDFLVRVVFKNDKEIDMFVPVRGKTINESGFGVMNLVSKRPPTPGQFGPSAPQMSDDWKKDVRRNLAKMFPAIRSN